MPATLKVQVYHSTGRNLQGYTLKIRVTEAEEMSPAVFVFQRPRPGQTARGAPTGSCAWRTP